MSAVRKISDMSADTWHQQMCQALRFGKMLEMFPDMVKRCLETRFWEQRTCRAKGRPFKSALEYFTHNEPDGVGTTPEAIAKILRGTEVEGIWRKACVGAQGAHSSNTTKIEPDRGRAYTLVRLEQESPALYDAVLAGEMSANAAAIEAGFRKKPTPFEQVRRLLPKLTAPERKRLMALLSE